MGASAKFDEDSWRVAERQKIAEYLALEVPGHGPIVSAPFWSVAPYVAVWGIESSTGDETLDLWVISGNLPTDYCSARNLRTPRAALRSFASAWRDAAGGPGEDGTLGTTRLPVELRDFLASRATLLAEWADDESIWQPRPLTWWESWSMPAMLLGSLAGFFIHGSVFHLFGQPIGFRAHPVAELGLLGWIVLPLITIGYLVRGPKGVFVVGGIFIGLYGLAYLVGVAQGAYG